VGCVLEVFDVVFDVVDVGCLVGVFVVVDVCDYVVCLYFGFVCECVWDVCDEWGCFCVDFVVL